MDHTSASSPRTSLCVQPFASPFHGVDVVERTIDKLKQTLHAHHFAVDVEAVVTSREPPVSVGGEGRPIESRVKALLLATGGTEGFCLGRIAILPDPILLLAIPSDNSLAACLETLARIHQDGRRGKIFLLGGKHHSDQFDELHRMVKCVACRTRLCHTRLGCIGKPSDWLVASNVSDEGIRTQWGPELLHIDAAEVVEGFQEIQDAVAEDAAAEFVIRAHSLVELSPTDAVEAARLYVAMKRIVEQHDLQSLSLRCFDLISSIRTTGCFALARLIDEGIVSGCEGDIPSTLTMLWMQYLTGHTPFMANPVDIDAKNNVVWIAHCTIAPSLVTDYTLRTHFESGKGVALQGTYASNEITLARIGSDLSKVIIAEGDVMKDLEYVESRCRTQLKIRMARDWSVRTLLEEPLGNHVIVIPGHHASLLRTYVSFFITTAPSQSMGGQSMGSGSATCPGCW